LRRLFFDPAHGGKAAAARGLRMNGLLERAKPMLAALAAGSPIGLAAHPIKCAALPPRSVAPVPLLARETVSRRCRSSTSLPCGRPTQFA
jgi:hypothetical protein